MLLDGTWREIARATAACNPLGQTSSSSYTVLHVYFYPPRFVPLCSAMLSVLHHQSAAVFGSVNLYSPALRTQLMFNWCSAYLANCTIGSWTCWTSLRCWRGEEPAEEISKRLIPSWSTPAIASLPISLMMLTISCECSPGTGR